jgi:hypothetical protein
MPTSARTDSTRASAVDAHNYTALRGGQSTLANDSATVNDAWQDWDVPIVIGNPQRAVCVFGWATGNVDNDVGVVKDGLSRVEISFDNGTSWNAGRDVRAALPTPGNLYSLCPNHVRFGSVDDTIQIKVSLQQKRGTANNVTFSNGQLSWLVIPQAEVIVAGKIPGFV